MSYVNESGAVWDIQPWAQIQSAPFEQPYHGNKLHDSGHDNAESDDDELTLEVISKVDAVTLSGRTGERTNPCSETQGQSNQQG
jgi:hypothetical protein